MWLTICTHEFLQLLLQHCLQLVYIQNHHSTLVWKGGTHELHCVGIHTGWVQRTNPLCVPIQCNEWVPSFRTRVKCGVFITYFLYYILHQTIRKFTWGKQEETTKKWSRNYFLLKVVFISKLCTWVTDIIQTFLTIYQL